MLLERTRSEALDWNFERRQYLSIFGDKVYIRKIKWFYTDLI